MSKGFPILNSTRFTLMRFVENDIHDVFKGLSHPDIIRYYGISYDSLTATRAQMEWFEQLEEENSGLWWAIRSIDQTEFYGAIGLNNLSPTHRKAEIGFWLLPDYWRKGMMKEAISMVCKYAFEIKKLHRIEALVETENVNCKILLSKAGFGHEGTLRDYDKKRKFY